MKAALTTREGRREVGVDASLDCIERSRLHEHALQPDTRNCPETDLKLVSVCFQLGTCRLRCDITAHSAKAEARSSREVMIWIL
jgi:hypothetical protein